MFSLIICSLLHDLSANLDVSQVLNQLIEYFDDGTPKKKEEIKKLVNVILNKLSMVKDVKQADLFLFPIETHIPLLIKQFSFTILYFPLNLYWPHLSESPTSRRFKAFYHLMQLLITNNVMLKSAQVVDSKLPITNNVMNSTTPTKLLNGKLIKQVGNQLEILLFGNVVKSIGDLDLMFLLKSASWNILTN
ncbi:unnamed protein product [Rotaria magnacalcarata]|uniref:Uncharacterized protein n=1 Tax=Rotaria magnacalcarata TaxID=392030 RepID=A0A8S2K421_9BILA|nr:unnamed protein product [Rotaria magnacalcarata]CAF3824780.1 unnamed protein product [Rotaria magnacalcarata]CAF3998723.1 unnamed protein product [Rotaria magnacalcarata]